ncbi:MAG: S-layer homology domain-containing protein, partial [Ruminiclostridium sp.]|nr:S-layer homology domain-containing protein [Ruminiclostridium sp.]
AMKWCVMNGIINGKGDGTLNPQGTATRAETAQMIMNYMMR